MLAEDRPQLCRLTNLQKRAPFLTDFSKRQLHFLLVPVTGIISYRH
jgi:hypothetical protein